MSACLTNFDIQEVFPYRPEIHYNILENPLEKQIKKGRLDIPTAPGLGVTLNHETVDRFLTGTASL
jgi:galactonate dehydratase